MISEPIKSSDDINPDLKAGLNEGKKSSFIKVKSFAKSPASWKDNSPEKLKYDPKTSPKASKCIDLTDDKDEHSSATYKKKLINPVSLSRPNVFVVKNVVNNYSVSYSPNSSNDRRRPSNISPQKHIKINNPLDGKRVTITTKPSTFIKQVSSRDRGNGPNLVSTSIISKRNFYEKEKS